jgi:uncharacterized RDD family membrane protein YckC
MAEDNLAKNGSSSPAEGSAIPSAGGGTPANDSTAAHGESTQRLLPPQALPNSPAAMPPAGYEVPPGYPPPGYPPPGYPPPGYPPTYGAAQGYGQPGYPPGWAPAMFAPPPISPFGASYTPAGIGVRFGALVIDAGFVLATLLLVGFLVVLVDGNSEVATPPSMAISLIWMFFVLSYHPASWYVFDCTLGQRALGLRVRRRSDGQSLGFGAVNVRYLVFCVETLIFPLGIIAGAMAASDPMKRTWHDEAAGSVVVKTTGSRPSRD